MELNRRSSRDSGVSVATSSFSSYSILKPHEVSNVPQNKPLLRQLSLNTRQYCDRTSDSPTGATPVSSPPWARSLSRVDEDSRRDAPLPPTPSANSSHRDSISTRRRDSAQHTVFPRGSRQNSYGVITSYTSAPSGSNAQNRMSVASNSTAQLRREAAEDAETKDYDIVGQSEVPHRNSKSARHAYEVPLYKDGCPSGLDDPLEFNFKVSSVLDTMRLAEILTQMTER